MSNTAPMYELIFEGTTSNDEVSLRRLRAALVTEFELPIEEAKNALTSANAVIRRSANSQELEQASEILRLAGAAVSVRPAAVVIEPSIPTALTENLQCETTASTTSEPTNTVDPLDQISDVFRDLTEQRVLKQAAIPLKDASIPQVTIESSVKEEQSITILPWKRPKYEPQKPWWQQLVTAPEIIFSIGFSLFLVYLTTIFYKI